MFEPRIYRERINRDRFKAEKIVMEESDLWIGVDEACFSNLDFGALENKLKEIRNELKSYILQFPDFLGALSPIKIFESDPANIKKLKSAGFTSGTGPMAGIAGYVAEEICRFVLDEFQVSEIIVENGGDICLKINYPLNLALETGENKNFRNLGLEILPEKSLFGICSSSGTFGHSLSLGRSDLLMTVSDNTILADTWATALANMVNKETDTQKVVEEIPSGLKAVLAIKDAKMAYKGEYKLIKIG